MLPFLSPFTDTEVSENNNKSGVFFVFGQQHSGSWHMEEWKTTLLTYNLPEYFNPLLINVTGLWKTNDDYLHLC